MDIRHLSHHEIDIFKWNQIIDSAANHLCYAYSWYLDAVSPGWEALISSDYQFIMPLPVKKKYGISYVVQPILTQQLGILSTEKITEEIILEFVREIPYKSYALHLNAENPYYNAEKRPNLILNLQKPLDELRSVFSKNTKRNIDKSLKLNLILDENVNIDSFIRFHDSIDKFFVSKNRNIVNSLFTSASEHNMLNIIGVRNKNQELIAAVALIISSHRITYLMAASNLEGKETSAMFLLVNFIIEKHANKSVILDFEGSTVEGIARFYKSFGAKLSPYFIIEQYRPTSFLRKIKILK